MPHRDTLAPVDLGPTLCIGEILVEIMATTSGEGFREPQPLTGPYPSGAPAIFADQCGRFGCAAAMVGAVGEDDFGRLTLDRLERDGVDVCGVATDTDRPTGTAFVRYRPDGSRDFVYNIAHSAAPRFGWTRRVAAIADRAGHLHVMGSALAMSNAWEIIEKSAETIRGRGGTLSLDPNLRKELQYDSRTEAQFRRLVEMADLLLPSGDELAHAAGTVGAEDEAIARLFDIGAHEIVLKRGAHGATCFSPAGARVDAPAFRVKELDPTGAGDCFGGAYVASRRLGLPVKEALTYASAAGARNVTIRGPMEGVGTRAELDQFISETPRQS